MTKYYTLLVQEHSNAPWAIEFGDYYRGVVKEEMDDQHHGYLAKPYKNMKIICTGGSQAEIQAEVNRLNKEIDDYIEASMELGMTGG